MLKRKQKTCMSCIGVLVGIVVMMLSGLAFAQDVPEQPQPSAAESHSNDEITGQQESQPAIGSPEGTPRIDASRHGIVPPGMECCQCVKDETAFENMVAAACRTRYQNAGVDVPTETQIQDCITKLKADVLKSCPKGDRDGDGMPDDQDNCPDIANPHQASTDPNIKVNGRCRFIDNGDGTITDVPNRHVWLKDANSDGRRMSWDEANAYCQRLNVAGGGWRLPDRQEFEQLIAEGGLRSGHPFTNVQNNWYWMNIAHERGAFFNVRTKRASLTGENGYVWPVRNTRTN